MLTDSFAEDAGNIAVGAGKFAVGDIFIAVGDGKQILQQKRRNKPANCLPEHADDFPSNPF